MNREKIRQVADALENLPTGSSPGMFKLTHYTHECGAPACIAGWTVALDETEFNEETAAQFYLGEYFSCREQTIHRQAANILGLDIWGASALFTPNVWPADVSSKQAARVLRFLADYGVVDWETSYETETT